MLQALAATTTRHPLRGILYYAFALLLFACLDTGFKLLVRHYPVPLIAFVRYSVHALLMLAILGPGMGRGLLAARRPNWVIGRGMCLVLLTLFMSLGLQRLPLAEATAILFVAPLLVVLVAWPVLGERIGGVRWVAVLCGFAGVLLIVRPSGALDALGVALVLCGALSNTCYQLLSRILIKSENTFAMLFYSALAGLVCFGAVLPWFIGGPRPDLVQVGLFLGLGTFGALGHFFFTLAYRDAPASLLAPVTYLQLVWAGLLGWLVFDQLPDGLSLVGMSIIAASGMVVAVYGRHTD